MRDFAEEMRIEGKQKRSRQEMINKVMCKPGYTWNETVGRCLGPAGSGGDGPSIPKPENPGAPQSPPSNGAQPANPQQAIAKEVSSRAMKG